MTDQTQAKPVYPSPFVSEGAPSVADALDRLEAVSNLTPTRRRDLRSALLSICRLIGRPAAEVPANINWLHIRLRRIEPAAVDLSKKRFANIKADALKALGLTGCSRERADWMRTPSPAWVALMARIPDRHDQWKLSQFAQYCTAIGVEPHQVTDAQVHGLAEALETETFQNKTQAIVVYTVKVWNRLRLSLAGWPVVVLSPPPRKREPWTLPLDRFPLAFQAEVERWADGLANPDPLGDSGPLQPLRPATIKHRRFQVQMMASAVVLHGFPLENMTSLACLTDIGNFKSGLRYMMKPSGGKSTEAIHHLAVGIKGIAQHFVQVDEAHLKELQGICKRLDIGTEGPREKNRTRLLALDDPANLGRLLHLPEHLCRIAGRAGLRPQKAALLMQAAVAIEILLYTPMRLGNLATLDLERHLRPIQIGREARTQIEIPGNEVKNHKALHYELGAASTRLLDRYVKEARPILLVAPSNYLFPAQSGGPKFAGALGDLIKRTIREHTGLTVNAHLFRSIAGKIHNRAAPGDFVTLSHVLGDTLKTTMKSYGQFEQAASQAHYQRSVDMARGELMPGGKFRKRKS